MVTIKKLVQTYKYHILFWILIYAYTLYSVYGESGEKIFTIQLATELLIFMITATYLHFYFLNKFIEEKTKYLYFTELVAVILFISYLFQLYFSSFYNYTNSFLQTIVSVIFILFITSSLKIFRRTYFQKIQLKEIYAKQLETELSLLKSQVNPHFMFNTLNSIYGLSLEKSDLLPETVIKLSELMRYLLESGKQQYVNLIDEINFIQNYISLEKLRLQGDYKIEFNIDGNYETKKIPPMLLIPMVENCFKHGLDLINKNGFIKITISISGNFLDFYAENSKPLSEKKPLNNIGIKNLTTRLNLLYKNDYSLEIDDQTEKFCVALKVIL